MIPIALAVAFSAAKINEQRFAAARDQWRSRRSVDVICSRIDRAWFLEHMQTSPAFGSEPADRAALIGRFRHLHEERAACMERLIALQGEIPLTGFPGKLMAQVRECQKLRARCHLLTRQLNAPTYCGQLAALEDPDAPAQPICPAPSAAGNAHFFTYCAMRWQLLKSGFHQQSFRRSLEPLQKPQLDTLFAQLQVLHGEAVEQIWVEIARRAQKLVGGMALLQMGFAGAVPLSISSWIAATCASYLQAAALAKVFFASGHLFAGAGLVTALAMHVTLRAHARLIQKSRERIGALGKVKEAMEKVIECARDLRFRDIVALGARMLQRNEEQLAEVDRQLDLNEEKHISHENKFAAQQLENQSLRNQNRALACQQAETNRELAEQRRVQAEQRREVAETNRELAEQAEIIRDLMQRLEARASPVPSQAQPGD